MRRLNQQGFVAIIACVLVSLIIVAIITSFALLMRREQRQALDRQLSTQAFYAAESGVNYAVKKTLTDEPNCVPSPPGSFDPQGAVSFPCLLVENNPFELVYDVGQFNPEIFPIASTVDELTIAWQDPAGSPNWSNFHPTFKPASGLPGTSWGNIVGVLEVSIFPIRPAVITRNVNDPSNPSLLTSSRTYYLYPSVSTTPGLPGEGSVSYGQNAEIVRGQCDSSNTPMHCKVTIRDLGLTNTAASNGYVVKMRAIYNNVSAEIVGRSGGSQIRLSGAQRLIDVTGKASDVLRRIQVRLPVTPSYNQPIYAIETADNLCKLLQTTPSSSTDGC